MVKPNPHAYGIKICDFLLDIGFVMSKVDPCMFICKTMISWYVWIVLFFGNVHNLRLIIFDVFQRI